LGPSGRYAIHCACEVERLDGVEVLDRGKVVLEEQQHARGNGRERVVCCDAVMKKP
jgi:hypothetical protein